MGTRSVVAIPTAGSGWRGRYIHWDGYPSGVGVALQSIVQRDGYTVAATTLVETHTRWSSINGKGGVQSRLSNEADPYGVDGYGSAPDDEPADGWVTSDGDDWGTEWAYVLGESGITVFERTYGATGGHATGMFGMGASATEEGGRWVRRGTVRYADTDGMVALDA